MFRVLILFTLIFGSLSSFAQLSDSLRNEYLRKARLASFREQYGEAAHWYKKSGVKQMTSSELYELAWVYQKGGYISDATSVYQCIYQLNPLDTVALKSLYWNYMYLDHPEMAAKLSNKAIPAYRNMVPKMKSLRIDEVVFEGGKGNSSQVTQSGIRLDSIFPSSDFTWMQDNQYTHIGLKGRFHPFWYFGADFSYTTVNSIREYGFLHEEVVDSIQRRYVDPNGNLRYFWFKEYKGFLSDTIFNEVVQQPMGSLNISFRPGKMQQLNIFGLLGQYRIRSTEMDIYPEKYKRQSIDTGWAMRPGFYYRERDTSNSYWQFGLGYSKRWNHHELALSMATGKLNGLNLGQAMVIYSWHPGQDYKHHVSIMLGTQYQRDSGQFAPIYGLNTGTALGKHLYFTVGFMAGHLSNTSWSQGTYLFNYYDDLRTNYLASVKYIVNSHFSVALTGVQSRFLPFAAQFPDISPVTRDNFKYQLNFTNLTLIFRP